MALRIIRKSSSQSQVELIKGSTEAKPAFSLAVFLDSAAEFESFKALLETPLLQTAELLIYKTQAFEQSAPGQSLRNQLPAMPQTAKLINESKAASWSLRLRTVVQEASSEFCAFMPFAPDAASLEKIPALLAALRQDPGIGLIGPALTRNQVLLAAGQDVPVGLPSHTLAFEGFEQHYHPEHLFALYRALPASLWQVVAGSEAVQVPGVPLALAVLRREAYLSLSWADQDWELPWLAQDLALGLRQKQYKLAIGPEIYELDEAREAWLTAGPMPESFREKWQPVLRQVIFEVYRHHGWKQSGDRFSGPIAPSRIQAYLAQKG